MSKEALYRVHGDGNPYNPDKGPREQLDTQFPVTTTAKQPLGSFAFFCQLLLVAVLAVILPVALPQQALYVLAVVYLTAVFLMRTYRYIGPVVTAIAFTALLVAHMGYLLVFKLGDTPESLIAMGCIMACTFIYSVYNAVLFRRHWLGVASSGMLSRDEKRQFRKHLRLPKGMKPKPTLPAFAAALSSWLNYDPADTDAPGLYKSVAGSAPVRLGTSLAMAALWASGLFSPFALAAAHRIGFVTNATAVFGVAGFIVLIAVVFPVLLMFLFSAGILGKAHALYENQFQPKNWTPFVGQIQSSSNAIEKKSLYLGRVLSDGSPILYPAERMMRGAWIQGSPGSGKTLFVMQLIEQLIIHGYTVVTLDLKALTHELLWGAQAAIDTVQKTQKRYVPLFPFTGVHGEWTYLLDIFNQAFWKSRSPEERAGVLLGFFGIAGAQRYGESWYRDAAYMCNQHVTSKYPHLGSFHEAGLRLYEELKHAKEWELSNSVRHDGEHPGIILRRLGLVDALNVRPTFSKEVLDSSINLESLFLTPSVLHCRLPAVTDPVGNPELARVLLSSIMATAANMQHRKVPVVIVVDEFQRAVSRNLDLVLQQCRSSGVGIVLTNQSSADLIAVDEQMPDTIAGNTAMQAWIKAQDGVGLQQVQRYGGHYIDRMLSETTQYKDGAPTTSVTASEHLMDRLSTGLIDRVNSANDQFFLRLNDDGGYSNYGGQVFAAQMSYHTDSPEDYERRVQAGWPPMVPGMLRNGDHRPPAGPPSSSLLGPKNPKPSDRDRRRPTPLGQVR